MTMIEQDQIPPTYEDYPRSGPIKSPSLSRGRIRADPEPEPVRAYDVAMHRRITSGSRKQIPRFKSGLPQFASSSHEGLSISPGNMISKNITIANRPAFLCSSIEKQIYHSNLSVILSAVVAHLRSYTGHKC